MATRPIPALAPQSSDRTDWEDAVARVIEEREDISRSDAQGLMEGQHRALERAWSQKLTPERGAYRVILAATPGQGPSM